MGGKATLFLVMGFAVIFMIYGNNFNQMATNTTMNFSQYYYGLKCKHASAVGVNILNSRLYFNADKPDTVFTITYDGVTVLDSLITINQYMQIKKIVSIGTITLPHRVFADSSEWYFRSATKVIVQPSMFSKYAYFSHNEGNNINWAGKDSILGPMHTNGNLQFSGNSVFTGLVTYGGTLSLNGNSPKFNGGIGKGTVPMLTTGVDTVQSYAAGGASITGKSTVYLEFRGDSIRYRYNTTSSWTYKLLSTWAANGVISIKGAEVHVKGNVKGSYSLGVSATTHTTPGVAPPQTGAGNIFIDDNITYNTNPKTNSSSTDMLGLVAENNIIVNNTIPHNNITIQAAMYAQVGSFTVKGYNTGSPKGTIFLYGGVVQYTRGAVGTGSGSTMSTGYAKNYKYDKRLQTTYPPHYPGCGTFQIDTWFE